jgi:hypothetical protein
VNTSALPESQERLLRLSERELVEMTVPPAITGLSRDALRALAGRLREARDRARGIARQQQREMRGKAPPRGSQPARDSLGTEAKAEVLVAALKRVTQALRPPAAPTKGAPGKRAPTQAELSRKALDMKNAGHADHHPDAGQTASTGMQPKVNTKPTVQVDPREIGRVSQAVKAAQARRGG